MILHFAELYWAYPGQREFNVDINGARVLTNFDIVAQAGFPFHAVVRFFTVRADANGVFKISFTRGAVHQPLVNAIEIRGNAG